MSEPVLLRPANLRHAADFDHAAELVAVLMESDDGDTIGEAMEAAASDADLSHAVMFRLLCAARGWEEARTGVELVANAYQSDAADLWTP